MPKRKHTADPYKQKLVLSAVSLLIGISISALGMVLLGKVVEHSAMTLESAILPVTILGTLGAFTAGYCMTRLAQLGALVSGLSSGGVFTLIFAAAVLWNGIAEITWHTPLKICCFLLGGTLGGAVAAMKPSKARHRR